MESVTEGDLPVTEIETVLDPASSTATDFTIKKLTVSVTDIQLAQALRLLTPQRRDILLLAYYLDKSDAEIGAELDLGKSTVQRRRQAGLERLRQIMGERE